MGPIHYKIPVLGPIHDKISTFDRHTQWGISLQQYEIAGYANQWTAKENKLNYHWTKSRPLDKVPSNSQST